MHRPINAKPRVTTTRLNDSEPAHTWTETEKNAIIDHERGTATSMALLVVVVFFGFTLMAMFLLWRRHRYLRR